MPIHLYVAETASGKSAYVLRLAVKMARAGHYTPRIVVPTRLQARALRHRLAQMGGALGVRVLTFDGLIAECLNAARAAYTELSDPVQYRLLRVIVDHLGLTYYAPLLDRPGFIRLLERLIHELKAGMISPAAFARAVDAFGGGPRLRELAQIYAAYQARLQEQGWADRVGLGWLAVDALDAHPLIGRGWPLLAVDGFDDFTPVQRALLQRLAPRVERLVITLTGTDAGETRGLAFRRFQRTRHRLEAALNVTAEPLPEPTSATVAPLRHLQRHLFRGGAPSVPAEGAITLIEATNRATEVRAALRWLKARLVQDGMRPGEVALLARNIEPYRAFILQTATEFGLPVRLVDGLPLRSNPAVTALLNLLRLVLPRAEDSDEPTLPYRLVVDTWRSPYFDWSARPHPDAEEPIGIRPGDAETLDAVARWGRVIEGQAQWEEAFDLLIHMDPNTTTEEEDGIPAHLPTGERAAALRATFHRFLQRITPPQGKHTYRTFVGWLEGLIGEDPELQDARFPQPEDPTSLRVVQRARAAEPSLADRDVAALQALKDVLRGLVWAEEVLHTRPVTFATFFQELVGAVEAAFYHLPFHPDREEVLVANVVQARGLSFRAVAVLGLAEGEFPATLSEDPLLPDAERARLRAEHALSLDPTLESAEAGYFYETLSRAREQLLLTRPILSESGAEWLPSPFWEEVQSLVQVTPMRVPAYGLPTPEEAASPEELVTALAPLPGPLPVPFSAIPRLSARINMVEQAARVLRQRRGETSGPRPYDGDLTDRATTFAEQFGPHHMWSASRLEIYRSCPFHFFVGHVLHLEPRQEPREGLDARQLGNIYHHILERVYREAPQPLHLDGLLQTLERVAATVLAEAPRREGFRATAWWEHTRAEIVENLQATIRALEALREDFTPHRFEAPFGMQGAPPLEVHDENGDTFRLRGLIDRVDRDARGRIRIIDYKTAGPTTYKNRAVADGKRIQLPLYALAARDALGLGEPVDGFYWHVRQAQASDLTLRGYGVAEAIQTAVDYAWEAVRGARAGHFIPDPPRGGCPAYCPARAFCWHYREGFGG